MCVYMCVHEYMCGGSCVHVYVWVGVGMCARVSARGQSSV